MTFQVRIAQGGISGWSFLNRSQDRQKKIISSESEIKNLSDHLIRNLSKLSSTEALVKDYKIRKIVLTAFGLQDDLSNIAFITKVINSDLSDPKSFVNRLSDKRYTKLTTFFSELHREGGAPSTQVNALLARFIEQTFEARVGEADQKFRIALTARRDLKELSTQTSTNEAKWFKVLGNPSLRKVFEGLFNLGGNFSKLPIDRQHKELIARAERTFGSASLDAFADDAKVEALLKSYIVKSSLQAGSGPSTGSTALQLLSNRRSFWRA